MQSVIHLIYVFIPAALAVWMLRQAREKKDVAAMVLIAVLIGMIFNLLVMGLGRFIGFGPTLLALSWMRFGAIPLFGALPALVAAIIIARAACTPRTGRIVLRLTSAIVAVCIAWELSTWPDLHLYVNCSGDIARYTAFVPAHQRCSGAPAAPSALVHFPFALIGGALIVLFFGVWLLLKRRDPTLLLGSLLGMALSPPVFPPFVASLADLSMVGALAVACMRYPPKTPNSAEPACVPTVVRTRKEPQ